MKPFRLLVPLFCLALGLAVFAAPPKEAAAPPDADALKELIGQARKLERQIAVLRSQGVGDPFLAGVQVYHKAAEWVLPPRGELPPGTTADMVREILDRGLLRASQQRAARRPGSTRPDRRPPAPTVRGWTAPYSLTP